MGYNSTIELNVTIGKVDEFRKYLGEIKKKVSSGKGNSMEQLIDFFLDIEDGWLVAEEHCGKWYEDKEMVFEIAKFDADGTIEFIGDDGERWGYMFEEDGIYDIEYTQKKGKKLYDIPAIIDCMVENTAMNHTSKETIMNKETAIVYLLSIHELDTLMEDNNLYPNVIRNDSSGCFESGFEIDIQGEQAKTLSVPEYWEEFLINGGYRVETYERVDDEWVFIE